jgi:SprT protein
LEPRLRRASRIGRAFGECLDCVVLVSRRAKIQAGAAHTKERRIIVNAALLVPGREADRDATFLHECAHIVADLRYGANCRHDWRWRRVMKLFGEPPEVCHSLPYISPGAHAVVTWVCHNCGGEYHFVRPPRRRIEECYCRPCGPHLGRLRIVGDLYPAGGAPGL